MDLSNVVRTSEKVLAVVAEAAMRALADHLAINVRLDPAAADFAGGAFAITDTGRRGALFDTPLLGSSQTAILGLGSVVRRPVALIGADGDEVVAVRSMAYLSLTYDPQLVDGGDAADYLTAVKERLESRDGVPEVAS